MLERSDSIAQVTNLAALLLQSLPTDSYAEIPTDSYAKQEPVYKLQNKCMRARRGFGVEVFQMGSDLEVRFENLLFQLKLKPMCHIVYNLNSTDCIGSQILARY